MTAQYVGNGYYQVFIINIDYPCDFIEVVKAMPLEQAKKTALYISDWKIISPFKPGEKVFIDELNPSLDKIKKHYFFDTKLRKPTRLVEAYEATTPAAYKLPKTIGSEYIISLTPRDKQLSIRQYIDEVRLNMKDRYDYVWKMYSQAIKRLTPNELDELLVSEKPFPTVEHYSKELEGMQALEELYNNGVKLINIKDNTQRLYYSWFIKDWGLDTPTGKPPEKFFELERVINYND